jgi:hypothetical protein
MARRRSSGFAVSFFAFQDIITSVVGIFVLITLVMMVNLLSRTAASQQPLRKNDDVYTDAIRELEERLKQLQNQAEKLDQLSDSVGTIQVFNKEEVAKQLMADLMSLNQQIEKNDNRNSELQRINSQLTQSETKLLIEMENRSPDRDELKNLIRELERLDTKVQALKIDIPLIFKSQQLQGRSIIVIDITRQGLKTLDLDNGSRINFGPENVMKQFRAWIKQLDLSKCHFIVMVRPRTSLRFVEVRDVLDDARASYGYDVLDEDRLIQLRSEAENL